MKLGVLTVPLYGQSFKDACKYLADSGVQALEIGAGGCPGKGHCDPAILLNDAAKLEEFKAIIKKELGTEFPDDAMAQLNGGIGAVFRGHFY